MTIKQLASGIQQGSRRCLSKGITLVESSRKEDQEKVNGLLSHLPPKKDTLRVGISGVPGVGKSTFIESLGNYLIEEGHRVAVLAIDPSSPTSGGSILGDKTRMETLSAKEDAFIRPSPTSGTLGGVAKRTRETIRLCEAANYDIILIETVGVGQSEYEVASMVDCFLLMMLPGGGDSLQGIKRGILEITDILVINKADGDLKKLAEIAKSEYEHAFHILASKHKGIKTSILSISALQDLGVIEVWNSIKSFRDFLVNQHLFELHRNKQEIQWFKRLVEEEVLQTIWSDKDKKVKVQDIHEKILKGAITPYKAASRLISSMKLK